MLLLVACSKKGCQETIALRQHYHRKYAKKQWLSGITQLVSDYVCGKMFDRKQFITNADLEMGGHIQKLVALELHINGPKRQRQFWEEHEGRVTIRNTVRKKMADGSKFHEACIPR